MVPRWVAQLGRRVYPPGLWEGPRDRRWVALTFDDGPHPEVTPRLLTALSSVQAAATFFLIGRRAEQNPDLVRRIQAEGHEVGNHTWDHRPLTVGACRSPAVQIARTEAVLEKLCPGSPRIFRPPFGAIGVGGRSALAQHGLLPIYWSVVPADWDPLPPDVVTNRVLAGVHPGAVIVLHGGRPWHAGGVQAVEGLVTALREQAYEIVSLPQMLTAAGFKVGRR